MSAGFQAVQWNRAKIVYDIILLLAVGIYLAAFMGLQRVFAKAGAVPGWDDLRIGAFGTCAFLMISFILAIGPLARLNTKFLPLLYNRRHFGVLACVIAAAHGYFIFDWFAARNAVPSLWNELVTVSNYTKFIGFTVKPLGLFALLIFVTMAATSHDYWLKVLTPPVWKAMHMAIYIAYGVLVMHVALGIMQRDYSPVIPVALALVSGGVAALHIIAGWNTGEPDASPELTDPQDSTWLIVGAPEQFIDGRARIIAAPGGERIAVFRDGARFGAVTNLCAHQNGPLGEGKIVNGCIVCPWHGWEYRLEDGRAPPPFEERLATFRVRLREGAIEVDPAPLPPGTPASITIPV